MFYTVFGDEKLIFGIKIMIQGHIQELKVILRSLKDYFNDISR